MTIQEIIEHSIRDALRRNKSQAKAAVELGISTRTIRNYLRKWGVPPQKTNSKFDMKNLTPEQRDYLASRRWGK